MRVQQLELAEAEGTSFWTMTVPPQARVKIAHLFKAENSYLGVLNRDRFAGFVAARVSRSEGLLLDTVTFDELARMEDQPLFLSFVEATHAQTVVEDYDGRSQEFVESVNRIFDAHRVALRLVAEASQIVPLDSFELHTKVVEPVIRLLHGRPDLHGVQIAYMDSLNEIADGKPADAITDAGTALQETFKALHVPGKVLGDQIKSVRLSGQLPGRDAPLLDAVVKAMEWVASERNQNGDAHNVTDAKLDDAWLIVHVVGALIVRLTGSPRE